MNIDDHTAERIHDLLTFFAARGVNRYGEPPNVDFVLAANELAAKIKPAEQQIVNAGPNDTLEDKIMDAWHVTDDLDVLFEAVMEDDEMTKDEIANIVLGLHQLYHRKFDRLFRKYEEMIRLGHLNPFPNAGE
jgi:hypothetical protein